MHFFEWYSFQLPLECMQRLQKLQHEGATIDAWQIMHEKHHWHLFVEWHLEG